MPDASQHQLDPTTAPSLYDVDILRIARVYAKSLLQAAQKVDKVDLMQQHFDDLFFRTAARPR